MFTNKQICVSIFFIPVLFSGPNPVTGIKRVKVGMRSKKENSSFEGLKKFTQVCSGIIRQLTRSDLITLRNSILTTL